MSFKRFAAGCLSAALSLCLCACGGKSNNGAPTCHELADRYLAAIAEEDYEAIYQMLPDQVVLYGANMLQGGKKEVLDFIAYAVHDYYWLAQADLSHNGYTYEVIGYEQKADEQTLSHVKNYLAKDGVHLSIQAVGGLALSIDNGSSDSIEGSFYMVRVDGSWYLLSVVGDDELFVY